MKYLLTLVLLASCAQYGGDGSISDPNQPDATEPAPEAPDAMEPLECPVVEECPDEECDSCCPEPPVSDPCDCFNTGGSVYDIQVCLSTLMRAQGVCTQGIHYDVRFYCKINNVWESEKTWVYPCDQPDWWEQP